MHKNKSTTMKSRIICFAAMLLVCSMVRGQAKLQYETFIYTSEELSSEIQSLSDAQDGTRGYLGDLFNAWKESGKSLASGYVTTFIGMGVDAIGAMITRPARLKQEWEKTVESENTFQTTISTVSELNDFYKLPSFDGAMDPKGMCFNGIGCMRRIGNDTVFYVSCHIDRSKLNRIINHSKFELVLDTLIISPKCSNLPNTPLDLPFSFKERDNFCFTMNMKLTSSWMNEIVQLQKDQLLGEFVLTVPVDSSRLDDAGKFRYTRQENEPSRYKIVGESFIVPRSFMGFRDKNGQYKNSWGTGEYKLTVQLKETCDVTDYYRSNWRTDRKRRRKMAPKEGFMDRTWEMISSQRWDDLSKQWVITTLSAPADIITRDVIDKLNLSPDKGN